MIKDPDTLFSFDEEHYSEATIEDTLDVAVDNLGLTNEEFEAKTYIGTVFTIREGKCENWRPAEEWDDYPQGRTCDITQVRELKCKVTGGTTDQYEILETGEWK